jgi:hypothetical protein
MLQILLTQETLVLVQAACFYELFIIELSSLPVYGTQARNWQSQNVALVLAALWGLFFDRYDAVHTRGCGKLCVKAVSHAVQD